MDIGPNLKEVLEVLMGLAALIAWWYFILTTLIAWWYFISKD